MNKKLYTKPFCRAVKMKGNMICMSIHDEEATVVGAKENSFLDHNLMEEEGFGQLTIDD